MSLSIKRQNHRIHPCNASRKNELLIHLIAQHKGKKILVITAGEPSAVTVEDADITVVGDEQLSGSADLTCDVLISYDLPEKALVYMTRLSRAREHALILLDAEDQKRLYGIETLLGRTIIQENIPGFEPDFGIAAERQSKEEAKARRAARDEQYAKQEKGGKRDDRGFKNDKKPADKWARKDSKPRFIGKDEKGKPMFEGKTRERNHYIDGTPRTEAEKAARTPFKSKPKFFGKDQKSSGDDKSAEGKKESFKGEKKPFGDKKPYGEKKPAGNKKTYGDKKPYGDKKAFGDKKPYPKPKPSAEAKPSAAPAEPKRPPRRIDVKSFKPSEKKQ